jgi:acetyl esterase/lipase
MMPAWEMLSRAERDAAYNNSAAVADSARHLARWTAASAARRAGQPGLLDIPYGPGARCKWDLFPAVDRYAPCLVHIHGGYWQRNSREVFACLSEGVAQHGWSAALPGYTLAPQASLTAIVAELRRALDWLLVHRAEHGICGPMIVSGWSAGAHLAVLLLDHPLTAAALAVSGIYELGPLRDTYLDDNLRLTDGEIATLSPLRRQQAAKPVTIAYGTRELPSCLIAGAGDDHFSMLETLRHPAGLLTRCALRLSHDVAGAGSDAPRAACAGQPTREGAQSEMAAARVVPTAEGNAGAVRTPGSDARDGTAAQEEQR